MTDRDPQTVAWHALSRDELARQLGASPSGLSAGEAQRRLAQYGPNELQAKRHISAWTILWSQFQNVLLVILIIATALSAALGHELEAGVIAVIVLLAVALGFYQEFRAERAMEALRDMAAPSARVLRDGAESEVPARELVPGDLLLLEAGARVPADGRLVEVHNLQVEESALTGESVPAEKTAATLAGRDLALGDRHNMVYAGTSVTYGRGRAVVVATGMNTEFGRIAAMLQTLGTARTPLQQNLDKVGKALARMALVIVLLIVALGLWRAKEWTGALLVEMLVFGVALAVAVVPEALPAVVTISLALGVQRMVKRNALIRHLPAVETLGSTSVICSDKTGTLTKDEMTVRQIYAAGRIYDVTGAGYEPVGEFLAGGVNVELPGAAKKLLRGAALCNDAQLTPAGDPQHWELHGDPTEGALVVVAAKAGLHQRELERESPRIDELPFSSEAKRMTTLHAAPEGPLAFSKGAPEVILPSCTRQASDHGDCPLDEQGRQAILAVAGQMAEQALRVLAVAAKHTDRLDSAQEDLTFLGLLGLIDPPRPEAKAAIAKCAEAGIKVVMITGDHPVTARAVAQELGLLSGRVVSGGDLDAMPDDALAREVESISVYARVSPAHKLRIITAFQQRGHIVAMTGDGVNDAPALKKADIGIAMGITGTDVSKEASAMMLLDDNFATIVAAVEEGRGIFGNIKKYLMYLLSANIGEIGLMAGASVLGLPVPLSAVQLLYVNLATDGLPALALAVDPPEDDLMRLPPRDPRTGVFTPSVVRLMCIGGAWSAVVNLVLFAAALWYYSGQLPASEANARAMTAAFVSLVLIQFFKAYSFRSDHLSVRHRTLANRWLNYAILWELALLALLFLIPLLRTAFRIVPLNWGEWLIIVFMSHTILPVLEFAKWLERKKFFGGST